MSESGNTPAPLVPLSRRRQFLILAVAAAVLVGTGVVVSLLARWFGATPEQQQPVAEPGTFRPSKQQWASLVVEPVTMLAFTTEIVADGSIAYDDDTLTPVFSPYSGRVTRLLARPGDVVRQGAPLFAIEASEFAQGQSDLRNAHAQVTLAEANERRQHELYLAKSGALKDWLQAQADATVARNALDAARNRLRILGKSDAEIAALEAGADKRGSTAEAIVRAPIAGTITQRQVGVGQYVGAGASTPVFTIGDLSRVWLVANARETDAAQIRVGQAVGVRAIAFPDRTFNARITWVAPAIDPATHRLAVRAEVENHDGVLKPLMFASFRIEAGEATTAPAVPKSAIVYEGDNARVFVARDDGSIALRAIRTGRSNGDRVEVRSGLNSGEKVVSGGTLFIDRATDAGGT